MHGIAKPPGFSFGGVRARCNDQRQHTQYRDHCALLSGFRTVFYFASTYCTEEASAIERWPHISAANRAWLKKLVLMLHVLPFLLVWLELAGKRELVLQAIKATANYLAQETGILRTVIAKVLPRLRPRVKVPGHDYYMPGQRWWEDGPLALLFGWLMFGQPGWYEKLQAMAPITLRPLSEKVLVDIPVTVTSTMLVLLSLIWVGTMINFVTLPLRGLWQAPESRKPYAIWLKERIRKFDETADRTLPSIPTTREPRVKLKLTQYPVAWLITCGFLWIIWPGLVYLLGLSAILWVLAIFFYVLAFGTSFALKYGKFPILATLLEVAIIATACWFRVL